MEEVQERFRFLQDSLSGGGGATTFQAEEEEERFRILQASLSGAGEATTFPSLTEPPSQMDQYQKTFPSLIGPPYQAEEERQRFRPSQDLLVGRRWRRRSSLRRVPLPSAHAENPPV